MHNRLFEGFQKPTSNCLEIHHLQLFVEQFSNWESADLHNQLKTLCLKIRVGAICSRVKYTVGGLNPE